jgi:NAD(P)-dependent dehydrogenase (short-subunit alcohol dehydrogenase family)
MVFQSPLIGESAVVTGVSRGIGRATAIALARAGANVAGVYLNDPEGARAVEMAIESQGVEAAIFEADTGDPGTAERLVDTAQGRWGSVDIWVNNAARLMVRPIVETSDDEWHGLLAANLHGYFYGSRAAARVMCDQGKGRIINVTSAADILFVPNLGAYATAKGGVLALSKNLALETARHGVTVNTVSPGAIDTPLNIDAWTAEVRRTYTERIPLGRVGSEDEVADVIVFLASEASRYMTGQEVVVDGGLVINGDVGHAVDD